MPDLPPALVQYLGGIVTIALVGWIIYRDWRRDKNQETKAQAGVEAQTDAHSIAFMEVVLAEQGKLRERVALLEDRERRHADVLQRHAAWDARVVAVLQQTDASAATAALGDPPPLYPSAG